MQETENVTLKSTIMSPAEFDRALRRIAHEVIERNKGAGDVALVGIHTRGVPLAERLADLIERFEGTRPPVGKLDITLYRDDLTEISLHPVVKRTEFDFVVLCAKIVVVVHCEKIVRCDEVVYTGWTARAALVVVVDMGRAEAIQFAVMVDRGRRELPIRADYVGKNVPTSRSEIVHVLLQEIDGTDGVE